MKKFYIKERCNSQFVKPYYVALGEISKKESKKSISTVYGNNYLLTFDNFKDYNDKIKDLENQGFIVYK